MERQKINLSKHAKSNSLNNRRNNTYFNQAKEIQPQFGETQIHPKIEANSIFCYNSSRLLAKFKLLIHLSYSIKIHMNLIKQN